MTIDARAFAAARKHVEATRSALEDFAKALGRIMRNSGHDWSPPPPPPKEERPYWQRNYGKKRKEY